MSLLPVRELFRLFATRCAHLLGTAWAFLIALLVVVVWALTGPVFHFSDTWQLVINTGTTIITFLMVFLIQNTQNRDARAMHLKLDELIRVIREARNDLVDIEDSADDKLEEFQSEFRRLQKGTKSASGGGADPQRPSGRKPGRA